LYREHDGWCGSDGDGHARDGKGVDGVHPDVKLFGADIRYETVDGVLKGLVELPVEQLAADEFALRLEFYGSDSKGGSAGGSAMRLIDGTGGIVREMHPTDGHDMLLKLKELIPPRGAKGAVG
jgi:hypothetical protein